MDSGQGNFVPFPRRTPAPHITGTPPPTTTRRPSTKTPSSRVQFLYWTVQPWQRLTRVYLLLHSTAHSTARCGAARQRIASSAAVKPMSMSARSVFTPRVSWRDWRYALVLSLSDRRFSPFCRSIPLRCAQRLVRFPASVIIVPPAPRTEPLFQDVPFLIA